MTNDIMVPVNGQQALAELGARAHYTGFTPDQVRALVARIQEISSRVALDIVPDLLDQLNTITIARFVDLSARVQRMTGMGPYVRRDQVLMMIQEASLTRPPVQ